MLLGLMAAIPAQSKVDYLEGIGIGNQDAYESRPNSASHHFGDNTPQCPRPLVSANGRFVVFSSSASNLVEEDTNGVEDVFLRDTKTGRTERVSVSSSQQQGNDGSWSPSISSNGRFVTFVSLATNFDDVEEEDRYDIFLRDRQEKTTRRISLSIHGGEPDSSSFLPSVSDDGSRVVYTSWADDVANTGDVDIHASTNVYLFDATDASTQLVSNFQASDSSGWAGCASISADGHYVAFTATGTINLPTTEEPPAEDTNVYRYDAETGHTQLVNSSRIGDDCRDAGWPSISGNGNRILYPSSPDNSQAGNESIDTELCFFDFATSQGQTLHYSTGDTGESTVASSLSRDGASAIFSNSAGHVFTWQLGSQSATPSTPSTPASIDGLELSDGQAMLGEYVDIADDAASIVYSMYQDERLATGELRSVFDVVSSVPSEGNGHSLAIPDLENSFPGTVNRAFESPNRIGAISEGGRYVLLTTIADNLVPDDFNSLPDAFVYDRLEKQYDPVTFAYSQQPASNDDSLWAYPEPRMSADGRFVTFTSNIDDVSADDRNGMPDIYLRDREDGALKLVSAAYDGGGGNGSSRNAMPSDDGRFVAFDSQATNLVSSTSNYESDVFVRDIVNGITQRIDIEDTEPAYSQGSWLQDFSGDGRFIAFSRVEPLSGQVPRLPGTRHYLHDRVTGVTERLFSESSGMPITSSGPHEIVMSDDGRFFAFSTAVDFNDDDANDSADIYVYDRQTDRMEWVTRHAPEDRLYVGNFSPPSISADGRYIAFSWGYKKYPNHSTLQGRTGVRFDRLLGKLEVVSTDRQGVHERWANDLSVSPDGSHIAFYGLGVAPGSYVRNGLTLDEGTSAGEYFVTDLSSIDFTGAFYDPANSGHGWLFEQLHTEHGPLLVATWYAYRDGKQLWMLGTAPIEGDRATVPMTLFSGADFPPNFDPASVTTQSFGMLQVVMDDSDHGHASWTSEVEGLGSGEADIARLSSISSSAEADQLSGCHSGSWYDPAQNGHGLQLQVIGSGDTRTAIAIWYHYLNGEPRWLLGSGPVDGDHADLAVTITRGPDFPPNYDPADQVQEPWGSMRFSVDSANQAQINWDADYSGYGDGSMNLARLTQLDGHACIQN